MDPELDDALTDLYYNIDNASAFSGIENLYKAAQQKKLQITKKELKDWLHKQKVYTLHLPSRKRFKRSKIISYGPMWLVEADLGIISDLKWYTGNYEIILLAVCAFTRFIFAKPLKTKSGSEVAAALREIFSEAKPQIIHFRTDYGSEFFNKNAQAVYDEFNIHHYGAQGQIKCAFAESHLRRLKQKLYKYYTKNKKRGNFPSILQKIVDGKNNTKNLAHGYVPSKINLANQHLVFEQLYPDYYDARLNYGVPSLKIGDTVRLAKLRSPFTKGFRRNYTDELFVITDVLITRVPPMFKIKYVSDNSQVIGSFYAEELVKYREEKEDN